LWAAVFDTSDDVRREIYNWKRNDFWMGLIKDSAEAGAIAPAINLELLFHQLDHVFRSSMLDWVVGELEPELLAPSIRYGYALILKGAASADWRGPLDVRLVQSQGAIEAQRRQAAEV
jgi:hypothetical protein